MNTDWGEIALLLGVTLVMGYNKAPNQPDYWSHDPSMGNHAIKSAISRNHYQLLISKLYFNNPEKGENTSKTYCVDELISCFKHTFKKAREDSPFQSIDESMAKSKGCSSLKQYLPVKPIKWCIKIWIRCDAKSGH